MWPLWTSKNHIFLFHTDIFRNCIPSSVYVCIIYIHIYIIHIYIIREKTTETLINLVGISFNWTTFLGSRILIVFVILSFGTCWKEKEQSKFSINVLIKIMLGWFLYLATPFSIGSFSFFVFINELWLVFIPKLGTMFTRN